MRASIVLNIEWVQFVLQNCEILHSVRGLYDKKQRLMVLTSPQMWCINSIKGWFTRPHDLLARFCKVNLSNAKYSAWFPGLIYCDQEPLWLVIEDDCYFLGVHIRLSTRCKIKFTLRWTSVCKLFFSKIT